MRKTVWAVCISLALALLFWGCRETDPVQTESDRNPGESVSETAGSDTKSGLGENTKQTETDTLPESGTETLNESGTELPPESDAETKTETITETETATDKGTENETERATQKETASATQAETKPETQPVATVYTGPIQSVLTKPARDLMMMALEIVSQSCGYSLKERTGTDNYDCSGFVAVLLRDALGEKSIGWEKPKTAGADPTEPWDTARWRAWPKDKGLKLGDIVKIGNARYLVYMRDSDDVERAWAIPGSIVIQYPPSDHSSTMGHASIALGEVPFTTADDVVAYILDEYGIDLSGMAGGPNSIPMVYMAHGPETGHTTWRINANGVAKAVCVDNHYSSDPAKFEKIALVLVPVE